MKQRESIWKGSRDACKYLKISDCELMHLRLADKIEFIKKDNAFFYLIYKVKKTKSK